MIFWKDLALIIQRKRIFMDKTIKEVSKDLGLNMYKYYRIENGAQDPTFLELQLILKYYNIELNIIFHE